MQSDSRTATYARIGRSYPRLPSQAEAEGSDGGRPSRRYWVLGGVVTLLAACGLAGWLLAR